MDDKRANWTECQLCDNAEFHPGTVCRIPDQGRASSSSGKLDADAEQLVKILTDQIIASMK
jgi:hypothetical protein